MALRAGELIENMLMLQSVTVPQNGDNMEVRVIAVLLVGDFQSADTALEAILQEVYTSHFYVSIQIVFELLKATGHMAYCRSQIIPTTVRHCQRHMIQGIPERFQVRKIAAFPHYLIRLVAVMTELVFAPAGSLQHLHPVSFIGYSPPELITSPNVVRPPAYRLNHGGG